MNPPAAKVTGFPPFLGRWRSNKSYAGFCYYYNALSGDVNKLKYIHLIPDYGGHKFSTSDRHACGIKSANFQKEVFCISSKGFNQRDAYRVMLRKYPDVMNIEQMCDALRISTKTGYKLLHEGKIPAMKIGRSYRIPKAHLFTYLQICGQHCRAENRQC